MQPNWSQSRLIVPSVGDARTITIWIIERWIELRYHDDGRSWMIHSKFHRHASCRRMARNRILFSSIRFCIAFCTNRTNILKGNAANSIHRGNCARERENDERWSENFLLMNHGLTDISVDQWKDFAVSNRPTLTWLKMRILHIACCRRQYQWMEWKRPNRTDRGNKSLEKFRKKSLQFL